MKQAIVEVKSRTKKGLALLSLLTTFLFFNVSVIHAQSRLVDSLEVAWSKEPIGADEIAFLLEFAEQTSKVNMEEAIALTNYGVSLSESLDDELALSKFYEKQGDLLQSMSQYDESIEALDLSAAYAKSAGDMLLWGKAVNSKAVVLIDQGDYHGGMAMHLEVLYIREQSGEKEELGYSYNYVCEDLYFLERFQESISYGEKAIATFLAAGHQKGLVLAYENTAWSLLEDGQNEKAVDYIEKAMKISETEEMHPEYMGGLHNSRGFILKNMERYEEALEAYQASYEIAESLNIQGGMAATMGNMADLYITLGDNEKALQYREQAVLLKEKNGLYINYSDNLIELSNLYAQKGDYEKALDYQKRVLTFRDSTFNKEKEAITQELTTRYEIQQKEEQLAQNEKERGFLYSILGLMLLGGMSLFWAYWQKQKSNKVLTELNEQKAFLIKEVHHRVKNNLQVISSLLQFQSRSVTDKGVKAALLDSQSRVRSMSLIHQRLYRGAHLAAIEMKSYLGNLAETLIDAYDEEDVVQVVMEMDPIELDVDYAIPLGLIANELVTNSLKYAFPENRKGTIKIQLQQQADNLVLSVVDDGVGLSATNQAAADEGFGSELIDMLAQQLRAKLTKSSGSGYNTQLQFQYIK